MDYMVDLFGDIFNQSRVISMTDIYLKYLRDTRLISKIILGISVLQ